MRIHLKSLLCAIVSYVVLYADIFLDNGRVIEAPASYIIEIFGTGDDPRVFIAALVLPWLIFFYLAWWLFFYLRQRKAKP
jgi:hypothetical protein